MIIVKCECGLQTAIRVWPFFCRCKRVYASDGDRPRLTSAESIEFGGPGTELKKLLAELGITSFAGCSCAHRAAQMNLWGVDGCREHFDAIREWLIKAQAQAGWSATLKAAAHAATSGLALQLDPLDIPGSLVRLAIERAAS